MNFERVWWIPWIISGAALVIVLRDRSRRKKIRSSRWKYGSRTGRLPSAEDVHSAVSEWCMPPPDVEPTPYTDRLSQQIWGGHKVPLTDAKAFSDEQMRIRVDAALFPTEGMKSGDMMADLEQIERTGYFGKLTDVVVPMGDWKAVDQSDVELRLAAAGKLQEVVPAQSEAEKPTQPDVALPVGDPDAVTLTNSFQLGRAGLLYCFGCERSSDVVSIYFCSTCKQPYCALCQHSDKHRC